MSVQKTVLTLGTVLNDTTGHRLILPPGDANFNIPYKIMDFWHREKLCLGSFLLAQQLNLKYFVFSVNRISNSVTHNCFSCLKKRKQKEKKYFQQCNTSRPFLFDKNINSLMINSNDCWQMDLLVQIRLFMDCFRMVGVKKDNLTPTQHLFGQVLCMVNLKTIYVFLQVLPSRTFEIIKFVSNIF